jgi:Mg2+-importing ATPase
MDHVGHRGRVAQDHDEPAGSAAAFWAVDLAEVLRQVGTDGHGLPGDEAARRLSAQGPNRVDVQRRHRGLRLLVAQFTSPIILILTAATVVSMALGDIEDGIIILAIILASGGLGFWQERNAGRAVDALLARVQVRVEVCRDGKETSIPTDDVVPGDLMILRAGDVIPADCRVIEAHELQLDQSPLTGEPFPVEKQQQISAADTPLAARSGALFSGSHVVSGRGTAVVVRTGRNTVFAAVSKPLSAKGTATGFRRGLTGYGLLLLRVMGVLLAAIFAANLLLGRPLVDSLLFSLALAVGLTPQLLPAIVSISLSVGARRMAERRVIVKRLDAIEDFGAMTTLLTDKTGTITSGAVQLKDALGINGQTNDEVRRLARLNAGLQRGFANPMDQAIMAGTPPPDAQLRIAEAPYDFTRKRLSVLVNESGTPTLITKGALPSVLSVCTTGWTGTSQQALDSVRDQVQHTFSDLSAAGYRVLGLARRTLPGVTNTSSADETDMTFLGLLAFQDPAKPDADDAIKTLAQLGISVRVITGDNRLAATTIANSVGLSGPVLLGSDIDQLPDDMLAERATDTAVFADVEPLHKERIVKALRSRGAVIGFLGDGINDCPALHAADVGISVDTGVDVAKQTAAIILLDKDLAVVAEGVRLGRQTFTNTLKYVRVNTSAAFGSVVSMSAATTFLPFLPLLPRQILLLNFLSDIPYTTISRDDVDPEQVARPRTWSIRHIRNFMLTYGFLTVAFDLLTLVVLREALHTGVDAFRTAWFIEFTITEIAVLLVLRTNRPFFRSRPVPILLATSATLAAITIAVPYTPIAHPLGLVGPRLPVLAALAGLTVLYVTAAELVKRHFPPDQAAATNRTRPGPRSG